MGETRISAKASYRLFAGAAKWEILSAPVGRIGSIAQRGKNAADWDFSRKSGWDSSGSQPCQTPAARHHRPVAAVSVVWLGFDFSGARTHSGC